MASSSSFGPAPLPSWRAIEKSLCWSKPPQAGEPICSMCTCKPSVKQATDSVRRNAKPWFNRIVDRRAPGRRPRSCEDARRYMSTEQTIRRLADTNSQAIQHRSLPTVFHKVGAALDMVQPKIPANYLQDILFNLNVQYFNAATAKLPVDVRVAALDYWDERSKLMSMANR